MESKQIEGRNHLSWLAQYSGGSRRQYERAWSYFEEFLGDKTESWILENRTTEDFGAHLVDFHAWLKDKKATKKSGRTLSDNSAKTISNAIRGYLKHIGVPLHLTRQQKQIITKVESTPEKDFPMSLRVKEQLLRVANPVEEYVLCAGISFGLRVGDFMKITRGMVEPLMNEEVPIQLPPIQTHKKGVKAYPLIDQDAYEAIEELLKIMDAEGRTDPSEPMLNFETTSPERELNNVLKGLFKKANIELGEFRVRIHILRKFLTDNLANVCSEDKWKAFVGKETKSPYVTAEGREAYKKVMRFTNLNGRKVKSTLTDAQLKQMLEAKDKQIEGMRSEIDLLKKQLGDNTTMLMTMNEILKDQLGMDARKTLLNAKKKES